MAELKKSDFTGLAKDYSSSRPDYSVPVLDAIFGLTRKMPAEIDFVDVGAGTGIWTRMVNARGCRSTVAVEPNDDMRTHGEKDSKGLAIHWVKGGGENTGLPDQCCDLLTMASSFHWVDFERGTQEFHRLLRSGGWFVALWNPRLIEVNPLLVRIEDELRRLKPDLQRVSSGRSGITETLTEQLVASPCFDDTVYLEGRHVLSMSQERYLGAWRSVNDLQVQLGPVLFANFLEFVEKAIHDTPMIEATYLTRAWAARRA